MTPDTGSAPAARLSAGPGESIGGGSADGFQEHRDRRAGFRLFRRSARIELEGVCGFEIGDHRFQRRDAFQEDDQIPMSGVCRECQRWHDNPLRSADMAQEPGRRSRGRTVGKATGGIRNRQPVDDSGIGEIEDAFQGELDAEDRAFLQQGCELGMPVSLEMGGEFGPCGFDGIRKQQSRLVWGTPTLFAGTVRQMGIERRKG